MKYYFNYRQPFVSTEMWFNKSVADRQTEQSFVCVTTKKLIVFLAFALSLCAINKATAQHVDGGTTGNCTWELTGTQGDYTLTISGDGAMDNYSEDGPAPWPDRDDIKKIIIEEGVTAIGDYAFSDCDNITEIEIKAKTPPTIGDEAFQNISEYIPVYVPCRTANVYTNSAWGDFDNIIQEGPYAINLQNDNPDMGEMVILRENTCEDNTAIIKAIAKPNYHFAKWMDDDNTPPTILAEREITVLSNATYTAVFVPDIFNITILPKISEMGEVITKGYPYNTQQTITAIAANGYKFVRWEDDNNTPPTIPVDRTITVTGVETYIAMFEPVDYLITAVPNDTKMGNVSGGGKKYSYNTQQTITAIAANGYKFVKWEDDDNTPPTIPVDRKIIVTEEKTYTAMFEPIEYYIEVINGSHPKMGDITGTGNYPYDPEELIKITAKPRYGYEFVQWENGSRDTARKITVTEAAKYTAYFAEKEYTVTVKPSDPDMGYTVGSARVKYNEYASSIAAFPNKPDFYFVKWSDGYEYEMRSNELVTRDTTYTAIFAACETGADLISLSVNDKTIEINPESEQALEYTAPCGSTEVSLNIQHSDKAKMTLSANGGVVVDETDSRKIIRLTKDITTITMDIVSENGRRNSSHNLRIYRSFDGDGLLYRRWSDLLAVNTNPATNGGKEIDNYRWYNKNSEETVGYDQFYFISKPPANNYYAEISIGGNWHKVCGIPEETNIGSIVVYPNPVVSGENLTLQLPVEFVGGSMDVISISGTVMKRNVSLPDTQTDVRFSDLPSGIYMLNITGIKGNRETVKIIVGN